MGLPTARTRARSILRRRFRIPATDALKDPVILSIERKFCLLRNRLQSTSVSGCARLGALLDRAHGRLRSLYWHWLQSALHLPQPTACRYVALSRFRREQPDVFAAWSLLGCWKLERISHLTATGRRRLLKISNRVRFLRMDEEAFMRLTARFISRRHATSPDMKAHGLHLLVRHMLLRLHELHLGRLGNSSLRERLRNELEELSAQARGLARKLA